MADAPNEEEAPQIRIFFDLLSGFGADEGLSRCKWRRRAPIAPYRLEVRAAALSKEASPI
jgi:hypothetical protein